MVVVLVEEALVNILARFSLRSIARFRSVCKEWKSIIDSQVFRGFYESVSSSSSSVSWSIMSTQIKTPSLEFVGHYECDRWGVTNSLDSFITRYNPETIVRKTSVLSCTDGLVLLYTETIEGAPMYHVGNPLLGQWVRIPFPPHLSGYDVVRLQEDKLFSDTGLVTKMEKGIAVGYKVVWMLAHWLYNEVTFMIYSSETGLWETKKVCRLICLPWSSAEVSVALNGILHWLSDMDSETEQNCVESYDFYNGGGDEFCTLPFPGTNQYEQQNHRKKTITTSAGSVVYCNVSNDDGDCTIRVWRLVKYCNNDSIAAWKLLWELNTNSSLVGFGTDYFPIVMHPLNSEIIYLWSRNKRGLVLLNLRTHKFSLHKNRSSSGAKEENKSMDGCIMRLDSCMEFYMASVFPISQHLNFSQFVLPRWLNPLPQLAS